MLLLYFIEGIVESRISFERARCFPNDEEHDMPTVNREREKRGHRDDENKAKMPASMQINYVLVKEKQKHLTALRKRILTKYRRGKGPKPFC